MDRSPRPRVRPRGLVGPAALALLLGLWALPLGPARAADETEAEAPAAPAAGSYRGDREAARGPYDEGEVALEEMRWSDAASAFWRAVEADQSWYEAHVRYQDASRRAGDEREDLAADYEALIEKWPELRVLKLHRLRLRPAPERLPLLDELCKAAAKDKDKDPDWLGGLFLELARARLATGDAKGALAALADAAKADARPRRDFLLLRVEALLALRDLKAARALLEEALTREADAWPLILGLARLELHEGRHAQAAERAATVVAMRPSYIAAMLVGAEALGRAGNAEECQRLLTNAERVNGEAVDVQVALGDLKARFDTDAYYTEALAHYARALEKQPRNGHALYGTAWVLERQKKFEEAEQKYRAYLDVVPNQPLAINSVGYCLLRQGRVSEAQRQFQRAVDLDENFVAAQANLGATYDAQAKYSDAIKVYEKILARKDQRENLRVLINCAFDHEAMGAYPKATKLLEQAHEVSPKDPMIMVWLGDNQYFQKRWKEAEAWYQKAIALEEGNFFAWRGLGFTLAQRKRWADALSAFERASQARPDDLDLYLTMGDICADHLDDPAGAVKHYQTYIQRGGTDPAIADIVQELLKELEKKKR